MFADAGWALYSLSGFVVGALVGMTGVGGGSLMTPVLILLFGFYPTTAVGTDLLFATVTKSVGTSVQRAKGTIDWRIVRLLASGSLPAALAALLVLWRIGTPSHEISRIITSVLGIALLLTAVAVLFRTSIADWAHRRGRKLSPGRTAAATVALGLVLGAAVTFSSVGAGAIGVTALVILYPEIPTSRIVGTDIAHAVPLTLISGLGHLLLGSVDLGLLGLLLLGSIPGVILGSLVLARTNDRVIRIVLSIVLLIVTVKLLT
ncbi:MAG: sulfite exporter TauE/SafE family protein [Sphingomonadaceae bacterium]|nr:sulfite exporter TauE/SafE family protein [Sphingomonadaceae bacterium]